MTAPARPPGADAPAAGPETAGTPPPGRGLILRTWLRVLALQAAWNPQRMQNLGLVCALVPWLRSGGASRQRRRRFCRRHYEFFNTNPYLAGFLVGGLLRLEAEEGRTGRPPARVRVFRESLARAFASLGDQLFWMVLQPGLLLLAVILGLLAGPWAALAPIAVFAVAELELRRRTLLVGWRLGLQLVDVLDAPGWHRAVRAGRRAALLLAGLVAGYHLRLGAGETALPAAWPLVALLGAVLAAALPRRPAGEGLFLLVAPLALLLGYL